MSHAEFRRKSRHKVVVVAVDTFAAAVAALEHSRLAGTLPL